MPADPAPSNRAGAPAATPPGAARSITRTSSSLQDKMIGRTLGKARLLKRLGRGGMGDVYLATHPEYNKSIAIKILPPDLTRNEELLLRFRREAESAARLEHPNLVEVYDIGEEAGFHFIVMAYVEGMNLQELLDDARKLEPREAARIAYEVARGLEAVHADGIIHRDIKPANILVSSRGEVKIVDFGLAFDSEDKTTLTVSGAVMGTPWYLSPEQAEGKRADSRSDLYSLGVCLYLMVTGVRPFCGETHMSVLYKQIHEKPKDPRLYAPDLPDYLAEVILKALEKKPEKRFSTATELAAALEAFLKGSYAKKAPPAPEPPPVVEPPRGIALPPAMPVLAAFLIGLALAGLFFVLGRRRTETVEPRPAPAPVTAPVPAPAPKPPPAPEPKVEPVEPVLFTEIDRRQIADRDYLPVVRRLNEREAQVQSHAEKAALSKAVARLSTALRVVAAYRAAVAAEKQPALRLRDGRTTSYAFAPLPAVHADSIVEYARKRREIAESDLAVFLQVDGEARPPSK